MLKKWLPILVLISLTIFSCKTATDKMLTELFVLACQGAIGHGHARSGRGYNYDTSHLTYLFS